MYLGHWTSLTLSNIDDFFHVEIFDCHKYVHSRFGLYHRSRQQPFSSFSSLYRTVYFHISASGPSNWYNCHSHNNLQFREAPILLFISWIETSLSSASLLCKTGKAAHFCPDVSILCSLLPNYQLAAFVRWHQAWSIPSHHAQIWTRRLWRLLDRQPDWLGLHAVQYWYYALTSHLGRSSLDISTSGLPSREAWFSASQLGSKRIN